MNKTLQQIWSDFNKELYRFILSRVKDSDHAKDILQDVFLKIHYSIHGLKDQSKLASWIYQITRNAIIDYFRKKKMEIDIGEIDIIEQITEQNNENDEFQKCIKPFVSQLEYKYKEAIMLTEFNGLSQKQLAEKLGISYSCAKSRVQRGKNKLKTLFTECCHIKTDHYGNIIQYKSKNLCKNSNCN